MKFVQYTNNYYQYNHKTMRLNYENKTADERADEFIRETFEEYANEQRILSEDEITAKINDLRDICLPSWETHNNWHIDDPMQHLFEGKADMFSRLEQEFNKHHEIKVWEAIELINEIDSERTEELTWEKDHRRQMYLWGGSIVIDRFLSAFNPNYKK